MGHPAISRRGYPKAARLLALLLLILGACRSASTPQGAPTPAATPSATAAQASTPTPIAALPTLTGAPLATIPPTVPPTPKPPSPADAPPLTAANAARLQPLARVDYGPWELVTALAWSADGRWIAAGVGERVELLEFPALQRRSSYRSASLTHSLAFSPDARWLAAASRDGFFRVWEVAALAAAPETQPGLAVQAHRKGANAAAFSPQFAHAAGPAGWLAASGGNDAVARFWDVASGENTGMMVGGSFAVPSIAFLPDGALLAVTNGDRIRLREVGSERIAGTFASDAPLYSLAVSPDGQWIAAGGSDNLVRVWAVDAAYRTGQERYPEAQIFDGHRGRPGSFQALVWQVAYSPAGDLLVSAGGDGALVVWATAGGQPLLTASAHPGGATSVVFHPDARLLATGGLDGALVLWGVKAD